jgi:hypothetical protein
MDVVYGPRCEFEMVVFRRAGIEMGDQRPANRLNPRKETCNQSTAHLQRAPSFQEHQEWALQIPMSKSALSVATSDTWLTTGLGDMGRMYARLIRKAGWKCP